MLSKQFLTKVQKYSFQTSIKLIKYQSFNISKPHQVTTICIRFHAILCVFIWCWQTVTMHLHLHFPIAISICQVVLSNLFRPMFKYLDACQSPSSSSSKQIDKNVTVVRFASIPGGKPLQHRCNRVFTRIYETDIS